MPRIVWDQTVSVNIRELDEQHKSLAAMINSLNEAITQSKGLQSITEVFSALEVTFKAHFVSEELLMQKYGYPGLKKHTREHDSLLEQIDITSVGVKSGYILLTRDVHRFMEGWWLRHIMNFGIKINYACVSTDESNLDL